jgi:DNA invertase Pin-like site-specific DNA recombinase
MSTPTIDALTAVIAAVSDRDRAREHADEQVRQACRAARDAGVPQKLIAEAAGVDRATIRRWTS